MIKSNQLMIGDWVTTPKIKGKITILSEVGICVAVNGVSIKIPIDEIVPIPLTAEILEKNEFVEDKDAAVFGARKMIWKSADDATEVVIWLDDTIPMVIVTNIGAEDETYYELPYPQWVHNLQHALRFCSIEEKIII